MNQEEHPQKQYPENYPYYEDEINLIDYLRVIWKWKVFIILMVILCIGVTTAIIIVKYPVKQITQCTILLNFPGIEKSKNPDGSMFNKEQIITPAILSKVTAAFPQKENEAFSEDIRGMIGINTIVPPEIQEKTEEAKKKGESYTFFPNQFNLNLIATGKSVFSADERPLILLTIIKEYKKDFEKKYGEEPLVIISFPGNFIASYDYLEIVHVFEIRIDNFVKFLDSKIKKAGFFRSQKTGVSFLDIRSDIELLKNIELSGIEADISTLKLTKSKEDLINQYKYKIKKLEVREKKKAQEASIALKLLKETESKNRYAVSEGASRVQKGGDTSLVIDSSFIENLIKNDYYSFLLRTALKAEVDAKNLEVDKEYLKKEIAILKEKGKEKEKEKENIAHVEKSLEDTMNKILVLSQEANELNIEYLRKIVDGAVQVISNPETSTTRSKSLKKMVLLAGVVGLFFAIFLAFFIEYIKKASKSIKTTN